MKLPTFFFLSVLPLLSSCSSMSPEERAFLLETARIARDVGISKLDTKHPQK